MRVPCRLVQNVYAVYAVAGRYLFIITVSLTKLSVFHCTVSNEQILVNNEPERCGRKRPRLNLFLYLGILLDGLKKITKKKSSRASVLVNIRTDHLVNTNN